MRLGLCIIAAIFAIALLTGDPKASAQSGCAGNAPTCAASSCAGSASCTGAARQPVRGVLKRMTAIRPVHRLLSRGCGG